MQCVCDEVLGKLPQNWYTNHQGKNIQQMCIEQEWQKDKQERQKASNAENTIFFLFKENVPQQ